ncbi:MAG: Ig-like domain-containing protein [bacterium]|nr:Ig-like domain-containing protein [bacterium]
MSKFVAALMGAVMLFPILAFAAGYGTPVIDGVLDTEIYGAPEAVDPAGDAVNWNLADVLNVYVCNDASFLYILYTVNIDLGNSGQWWPKYIFYIDTDGLENSGATTDGWGRNVVALNPHRPEYSLNSWHDTPVYGTAQTQFISWNGTGWGGYSPLAAAARATGTTSGVEYKIPLADIGSPDTIWVELFSTGGGGTDNAQDTSNDPANDWNATNWSDQGQLAVSTMVPIISGADLVRPQVASAAATSTTTTTITFSEPVDSTSAVVYSRYSISGDAVPRTVSSLSRLSSTQIALTWSVPFGENVLYTVTVDTMVIDLVGNHLDPTHASASFHSLINQTVTFNVRMSETVGFVQPVNMRGANAPLSWGTDIVMSDPDSNETYTVDINFTFADSMFIEYKFRHGDNWESTANRGAWLRASDGAARTISPVWYNDFPMDNTPPSLTSVDSVASDGIRLLFSERMEPVLANQNTSYAISPAGPTVTSAQRLPGQWNKVWLTVNGMAVSTNYTVTVTPGTSDLGGNPIVLGASRTAQFVSLAGPPVAPQNLVAQVSGANVVLTWSAVENVTGYKVYRKPTPYAIGIEGATLLGTVTNTTFTVENETIALTSAWYVVTSTN